MLTYSVVALIFYVAGAFSHKWAANAFKDATGKDAQAVADQAKAAVTRKGS